ncbi:MAG: ring-cleaving dioxygenase [Acholeplasmataceae bacterium]|nr:ring-cleaving dioxygenase [Acholeplasmataceae bacterium]
MQQLKGIHHVTAMTSSAKKIYEFFTHVLGLRLVKKTVNQDDIKTYHLFFADDLGSPGTDMTFFDFPNISKAIKGTNEIDKTGFRVPNDEAIEYWIKRFDRYQIKHEGIQFLFGIKTITFYDFDEQSYVLFSDQNDQGVEPGKPWQRGPVPNTYAITSLGPVFLKVNHLEKMTRVFEDVMMFRKVKVDGNLTLFEMGLGGNGASVIVEDRPDLPLGKQGYGGVHHVAFRIEDETELDAWTNRLNQIGAPNSGFVNRFYFMSLYTRLYPGLLFEFATEGPGFVDDEESYETLGETLALPPKLRGMRKQIEKLVSHIETKRSDKVFQKEYLEGKNE